MEQQTDHGCITRMESTVTCKECGGIGRVMYYASDIDVYGIATEDLLFVKDCPKCRGIQKMTMDITGVPDMYHDCDMSRIKWDVYDGITTGLQKMFNSFTQDFLEWQKSCKGLYLWSKTPGSGKTWMACCLAKTVMMRFNLRMKFVTAIDYMDSVSEGIANRKAGGFYDPSKIYRECDVLVLDDIGAQMDKDWQRQELFKLMNARQGLVTIYTSNYPVTDLKLDDRTIGRIQKSAISVHIPEESIRARMAVAEQDAFVKKVLKGE